MQHYWEVSTLEHELSKREGNSRARMGGNGTIGRGTIGGLLCILCTLTLISRFFFFFFHENIVFSVRKQKYKNAVISVAYQTFSFEIPR